MPYQVNRDTYSIARYFYGQAPNSTPVYHHTVMRDFYFNEFQRYQEARSLGGVIRETGQKLLLTWAFFSGPVLTLALFALPWVLRDKRVRFLTVTGIFSFAAMELVFFFAPNYAAPFTCLILALILQSMRHLKVWRLDGQRNRLGASALDRFDLRAHGADSSGDAGGTEPVRLYAAQGTRTIRHAEPIIESSRWSAGAGALPSQS